MVEVFLTSGTPALPLWIDVLDPTKEELQGLAENYSLPGHLLRDCLQPAHLPKHEKWDDTTFIIIRAFDSQCSRTADTVQSLTQKIALFLGDRFLISTHRKPLPLLDRLREQFSKKEEPRYLTVILVEILLAAVESYHQPLEEIEAQIHKFESAIFKSRRQTDNWESLFRTKSRLMTIKRMLWHSQNTVQKFVPFSSTNQPLCQDLRERIESLQFFSDSLIDDLNNLLNIQISLASNRTNEVVRILTIFSAFFLPLTFIVGVYGMNFKHMPELDSPYGYAGVWALIVATCLGIYVWFRKQGWIGSK
jgi:magnesium transporter